MAPELGFQDRNSGPLRSTSLIAPPRDVSPADSAIFTPESNFSLFSSASASGDRCSFASDAHDHDTFVSEISLHLEGHDLPDSSVGPVPGPNKPTVRNSSRLGRKAEKAVKGVEREVQDEVHPLDSARNSFSLALKECQERRSRSEVVFSKPDRRRPVSLDLNNVAASASPRLEGGAMKKVLAASRPSGAFPSPGTPNYRQNSVGIQKGWCSERVPAHGNANRRHAAAAAALLPFNNGRTLPSKWEDAERWIFSPVLGDGGLRPAVPAPQRRPKSKSGPLGPPGAAYQSFYSPVVPMFDGGSGGNLMAGSPFSGGVIVADGLAVPFGARDGALLLHTEPCMGRSASVHGCTELLGQSSASDEKVDYLKDAATTRTVSRRDMATQMSPDGSTNSSSPERRLSFSLSSSVLPIEETAHSRLQVRDVQIDERVTGVTVTSWSKKNRGLIPGKNSGSHLRKRSTDAQSSAWELPEAGKSVSKVKREEAKITAWENLQKAKAEAAIRKLEMNLEKKRSSSMDKILNKLRSAQKRAQEMRSLVSANQTRQVSRTSRKAVLFRRRYHMGSLSGCFTCHAF